MGITTQVPVFIGTAKPGGIPVLHGPEVSTGTPIPTSQGLHAPAVATLGVPKLPTSEAGFAAATPMPEAFKPVAPARPAFQAAVEQGKTETAHVLAQSMGAKPAVLPDVGHPKPTPGNTQQPASDLDAHTRPQVADEGAVADKGEGKEISVKEAESKLGARITGARKGGKAPLLGAQGGEAKVSAQGAAVQQLSPGLAASTVRSAPAFMSLMDGAATPELTATMPEQVDLLVQTGSGVVKMSVSREEENFIVNLRAPREMVPALKALEAEVNQEFADQNLNLADYQAQADAREGENGDRSDTGTTADGPGSQADGQGTEAGKSADPNRLLDRRI